MKEEEMDDIIKDQFEYLMYYFGDLIEGLGLDLEAVERQNTLFVRGSDSLDFWYEVNQYGGRFLVDVEVKTEDLLKRLSNEVESKYPSNSLSELVTNGIRSGTPKIIAYRQLVEQHLVPYLKAGEG